MGSMQKNNNILDAEIIVPLKYLSNIWRPLDLSLINCEIKLGLTISCVISEHLEQLLIHLSRKW